MIGDFASLVAKFPNPTQHSNPTQVSLGGIATPHFLSKYVDEQRREAAADSGQPPARSGRRLVFCFRQRRFALLGLKLWKLPGEPSDNLMHVSDASMNGF
jgi:hypothetical protein